MSADPGGIIPWPTGQRYYPAPAVAGQVSPADPVARPDVLYAVPDVYTVSAAQAYRFSTARPDRVRIVKRITVKVPSACPCDVRVFISPAVNPAGGGTYPPSDDYVVTFTPAKLFAEWTDQDRPLFVPEGWEISLMFSRSATTTTLSANQCGARMEYNDLDPSGVA